MSVNPSGDEWLRRALSRAPRRHPATPCPEPEALAQLLANSDSAVTEPLLDHVAECDRCGQILAAALDSEPQADTDLSSETDRARLAERLADDWKRHQQPPKRRFRPFWPIAALAGAAASVAFFWFYFSSHHERQAEQLIATAYSEGRPMEMRLPGASYGPVRQRRGPDGSLPTALVRAQAIIAESLDSKPRDPEWLALKARSALLTWDSTVALELLRQAVAEPRHSTDTEIDLATAYWEESERTHDATLAARSVELLSGVLQKRPDSAVALFNRALAFETIEARTEAAADWKRYLTIDSSSPWAAEARDHLSRLRQTLQLQHTLPQTEPGDFLRSAQLPAELYLDVLLRKWMAAAACKGPDAAAAAEAIATIGERMQRENGDVWVRDAARELPAAGCVTATQLARSVDAGVEGRNAEAVALAGQAVAALPRPTPALEMRAAIQAAYSRSRDSIRQPCAAIAELRSRAGQRSYRWIEAQAALEECVCWQLQGQPAASRAAASRAVQLTDAAHLDTLGLRARGLAAGAAALAGDSVNSWNMQVAGLKLFWGSPHPPMRAFQFFTEMAVWAESARMTHLAAALAREAARAADEAGNRPTQAMAHYVLANDLSATGERAAALQEFRSARHMFDVLPATLSNRVYSGYAQMQGIALANRAGSAAEARAALDALHDTITGTDNAPLAAQYHQVSGAIWMSLRRYSEAEADFEAALTYARRAWAAMPENSRSREVWEQQFLPLYRSRAEVELVHHGDQRRAFEIWMGEGSVHPGDSEAVLLAYMQTETRLALWALRGGRLEFHWIEGRASEIEPLVQRCSQLARTERGGSDEFAAARRELWNRLLSPVADLLKTASSVSISLDSSLRDLPVSALLNTDGANYETRILLRGSGGAPRRHRAPIRRALFVWNPYVGGASSTRLAPLADASREVDAGTHAFPEPAVLSGAEATSTAVSNALRTVDLFHFAGHALVNMAGGALVLSPEGKDEEYSTLDSAGLPAVLSRCQVAVLSACDSAQEVTDVPPDSLPAAFLRAGAEVVIASRWQVDSRSSALLMSHFYEGLARAPESCAALHTAALAVRRTAGFERPFYWAAYECYVNV